jgi:hypothetical protein
LKDLDKAGKRAVISPFYVGREDTGGKLIIFQVVGNAVTALALSGAGFIGTVAPGFIRFNITLHKQSFREKKLFKVRLAGA